MAGRPARVPLGTPLDRSMYGHCSACTHPSHTNPLAARVELHRCTARNGGTADYTTLATAWLQLSDLLARPAGTDQTGKHGQDRA